MTRKDYELIAEVFAHHNKLYGGRTSSVADELANDMANELAEHDPELDRMGFLDSCGVDPDRAARLQSYTPTRPPGVNHDN